MVNEEAKLVPTVTGFVPRSVKMISALLVCGIATAPAANANKDTNFDGSPFELMMKLFLVLIVGWSNYILRGITSLSARIFSLFSNLSRAENLKIISVLHFGSIPRV